MPPAIETIIRDDSVIDGFICPGHVSAITGSSVFDFIPEKYNIGCVISGFEPSDILMSILMLILQANSRLHKVEIQYSRAVSVKGTVLQRGICMKFLNHVMQYGGVSAQYQSGLRLKKNFEKFDVESRIPVKIKDHEDNDLCICGKILRGLLSPPDCPLFSEICSPENPLGACMVSNEGTCNSWYKYRCIT